MAIVVLIALSRMKFDVTQLTLTFLDFLLIDPDTFSFLVTIHHGLKWKIALGAAITLPLLALVFLARSVPHPQASCAGRAQAWRCSAWSVCR